MRISIKDLNAMLIILGLAAFAAVYFMFYTPMIDDTEALRKETTALKPRLEELEAHKKKEKEYLNGIDTSKKIMQESIKLLPKYVLPEHILLYVVDKEQEHRLNISSVSFSQPWHLRDFDIYTEDNQKSTLSARGVDFTLEGSFSYSAMKSFVKDIPEESQRTALEELSVSYNPETGGLTGSLILKKYYLTDGTEPYVAPFIPGIRYGLNDLFGSIELPDLIYDLPIGEGPFPVA